jgi:N-acyl homoserine lactone hydrolase
VTDVSRLYVLLCGYEIVPKTVSTRGLGERFVLAEPVCAYLLRTKQGLVLFDTGINTQILQDPALRREYYERRDWTPPVVLPHHELLPQLERIGVSPDDVDTVVLSHMHLDHTGLLKAFRRAKVVVQRAEYSYSFSSDHSPAWFDCDYDGPDLHWQIIDGDRELMPGLQVLDTRGHTPGHQSLVIDLPDSGTFILVADAGDLAENFLDEVAPGETSDLQAALESIRRIKRVAAERSSRIVLGHDPNFVQTLRLAPEWYG